jgi:hypothetical protein
MSGKKSTRLRVGKNDSELLAVIGRAYDLSPSAVARLAIRALAVRLGFREPDVDELLKKY